MPGLDFDSDRYTLSELLGNGRKLQVPRFQRNYAWTEENWEELWEDLMALRAAPKASHFMGSLVFRPLEDGRTQELIDGQQRITTCLILILAAIENLRELNATGEDPQGNRRAELLHQSYASFTSPGALTRESKLRLNKLNDGFLQANLINFREPTNLRREPRSNRDMWQCLKFFRARFREDERFGCDGAALAEFVDETVARRLLFVGIEVADHLSAFRVFETLNARGVRLSPADLIKNWLFSQFQTVSDQDYAELIWEEILAAVPAEHFTAFLRHYFCQSRLQVRAQDLFDIVRKETVDAARAIELLRSLASAAGRYGALVDPQDDFWAPYPELRQSVYLLKLLRAKQLMPPLLAALERLQPEVWPALFRVALHQTIRYNAILKASTHKVEPIFNQSAMDIVAGTSRTAADFYRSIQKVFPDDEVFRSGFAEVEFEFAANRKLIGYLLSELEVMAGGVLPDTEAGDWTIEHIEPQSSAAEWTDRLGNLIPLESSLNRRADRLPFAEKRKIYAQSRYVLARLVASQAEWGPLQAARMQRQMADWAVARWREDFTPN